MLTIYDGRKPDLYQYENKAYPKASCILNLVLLLKSKEEEWLEQPLHPLMDKEQAEPLLLLFIFVEPVLYVRYAYCVLLLLLLLYIRISIWAIRNVL